MSTTRMNAESRAQDLSLAISRIERGRAQSGATTISIASVAREAGVSTALIHNHYPGIAVLIRERQSRSSRAQRDSKHVELKASERRVTP